MNSIENAKTVGHGENTCPVTYTLNLIGGKWRLAILWHLNSNKCLRYSELKKRIPGITNMMLTQCLHELQKYGFINRKQYMEIPPRVEYSLTEAGESLVPIIKALADWGTNYRNNNVTNIADMHIADEQI